MNDDVLYHLPATPLDILAFWFSDKSRPKWFAKDPSFDEVVSARYGAVLQAAKRGELFQWRKTIRGRLAEIAWRIAISTCNSRRKPSLN